MNRRRTALAAAAAALAVAATASGQVNANLDDEYPRPGFNELLTYRYDGQQGTGLVGDPKPSGDGRFVTFFSSSREWVDDSGTTGFGDVFMRDTKTGEVELISVAADGGYADLGSFGGRPSDDGRFVMFVSSARNLIPGEEVDPKDFHPAWPFLRDRQTKKTIRLAKMPAVQPAMSRDARYMAWHSSVRQPDNEVFAEIHLYERASGELKVVSRAFDGGETNGSSTTPRFSPDGRFLLFDSAASNIVEGDDNGNRDAFILEIATGEVERISVGTHGEQGNEDSFAGDVSKDGRYVAFTSWASNLVPSDTNGTGGGRADHGRQRPVDHVRGQPDGVRPPGLRLAGRPVRPRLRRRDDDAREHDTLRRAGQQRR
jgi:Tol biopolymer transport system component